MQLPPTKLGNHRHHNRPSLFPANRVSYETRLHKRFDCLTSGSKPDTIPLIINAFFLAENYEQERGLLHSKTTRGHSSYSHRLGKIF